jgi:hypothetical protein
VHVEVYIDDEIRTFELKLAGGQIVLSLKQSSWRLDITPTTAGEDRSASNEDARTHGAVKSKGRNAIFRGASCAHRAQHDMRLKAAWACRGGETSWGMCVGYEFRENRDRGRGITQRFRWSPSTIDGVERAQAARDAAGEELGAARLALVLRRRHFESGEDVIPTRWLRRAECMLDRSDECALHGRLALTAARGMLQEGRISDGRREAERALEIARRYRDRDLQAVEVLTIQWV